MLNIWLLKILCFGGGLIRPYKGVIINAKNITPRPVINVEGYI